MICGVLLAGGEGRRFGGDKLGARLPDGRRIVEASLAALQASTDCVVLVTRPGRGWLVDLMPGADWTPVVTADAERGMGSSMAAGVRACASADGWLVALADMPLIRPSSMRAVAQALRDGALIATPVHAGRRGHPVGFSAGLRAELLALDGDSGGRGILNAHEAEVVPVPVDDPGIRVDVDTREDLATLAPPPARGAR